jgi:hypothetical protein
VLIGSICPLISRHNVRLESPEEPTTGHVHAITPDAELLAPAPPTIHHTIENLSIQTIQQFTTQQIQQENDVESLETIRQSIERFSSQDIVKARTCMILSLIGIIRIRVISLYVLHRRIN